MYNQHQTPAARKGKETKMNFNAALAADLSDLAAKGQWMADQTEGISIWLWNETDHGTTAAWWSGEYDRVLVEEIKQMAKEDEVQLSDGEVKSMADEIIATIDVFKDEAKRG